MSKGFDELLTFPTLFVYRIIAHESDDIIELCTNALKNVFDSIQAVESIPSKTGRFTRIHIGVTALDGSQLYKGYEILRGVDGIRMVF